jgi:hypothetical protein
MRILSVILILLFCFSCSNSKRSKTVKTSKKRKRAKTAKTPNTVKTSSTTPNSTQIDCLKQFQKKLSKFDSVSIKEFSDHWKITVSHYTSSKESNGAEGYKLHKKSCIKKMMWHEHPERQSQPKLSIENLEKK